MAKKDNNTAPEPDVAKPAPVQDQHPDFQQGGRYFVGIPGEKETDPVTPLPYVDAIYVDNDGQEYKAKISPVPTNKGALAEIPVIEDPQKEFAAIAVLPLEKQIQAVAELQTKLKSADKAIALNGKLVRLTEYKGVLMYTTERQVGEGRAAKTVRSPAANLLVNFEKNEKKPANWVSVHSVRPVEHVSGAAKGEATIPHFKLA